MVNALFAALGRGTVRFRWLIVVVWILGTGFAVQAGTPATVSATVSCTVPLSDLALPGLPGAHTITATFTSPLDVYRQR